VPSPQTLLFHDFAPAGPVNAAAPAAHLRMKTDMSEAPR
jgi:hypothetical protein